MLRLERCKRKPWTAAAEPAADGAGAPEEHGGGEHGEPGGGTIFTFPDDFDKVTMCICLMALIVVTVLYEQVTEYLEEHVFNEGMGEKLLAKMVKQYFGQPASSAGPERVFSAAGKMHTDLKKAAKDSALEHSLFAMQNTV